MLRESGACADGSTGTFFLVNFGNIHVYNFLALTIKFTSIVFRTFGHNRSEWPFEIIFFWHLQKQLTILKTIKTRDMCNIFVWMHILRFG